MRMRKASWMVALTATMATGIYGFLLMINHWHPTLERMAIFGIFVFAWWALIYWLIGKTTD